MMKEQTMTFQKLKSLELKLQRQLTSKNPSSEAIRKTREAIIKLKFDLGVI
jgi:hypothetical protein